MTFRLVLESGGSVGTVFELAEGENIIGRSSRSQIQLAAGDVSRGHLCIRVSANQALAENLSHYGTILDDKPLAAPTPLRDGQKLRLGRSTVLVFRSSEPGFEPTDADAASATAPPEQPAAAAPAPILPCLDPDTPQSDDIPSNSLPAHDIPSDIRASSPDSAADPDPDSVAAAPPLPPGNMGDAPLSGHIDFLDAKEDGEWSEPESLPAIGNDELLSRGSVGAEPASTSGRPAPEDDFAQAIEESDGPHTQMMSTCAIDYLRRRQEQKARLRTVAWITAAVLAAALAIGLLVRFL